MIKSILSILLALTFCACTPEYSEENEKQEYWRTSSSGVIHNSQCFWYGKSNGKYVKASASGRDCEKCGGRDK